MSWAEVIKINSDMSTPLDKLIKSQRSLGASDAVMAVLVSSQVSQGSGSGVQSLGTFTPKSDGSVRIEINGRRWNTDLGGSVHVFEDGVDKTTISINTSSYVVSTADISVTAGKTYELRLYAGYVISAKVCASIIDASLLDYTVRG